MSVRTPSRPVVAPVVEPVTHPRMRARRAEVARGRGRRRLRRVKVVLAVVCAIVWSLVALRSSLVDVDRVQVVGADDTTVDEVRAAAATPPGTPMAEADLDGARRRVAALPWVAEVDVTRMWPGTVRIVVTERVPVGIVEHPDGWAWLDASGRVLDITEDEPDLPALRGARRVAAGERLDAADRPALAVLGDLPGALATEVAGIATGDDGLELALTDGFRVVLGNGGDLGDKVSAALAVRQHTDGADDDACRIDVRVPSAPVLTTGRGCA